MSYIKFSNKWALTLISVVLFTACNNEWEGEQYENYLAFVNSGVAKVHIKYEEKGGNKKYKIPVQVTGSTLPGHDVNVNVVIDLDTIKGYNEETFRRREDLYYKPLPEKHYNVNTSTVIKADSVRGFIDVDFNFESLDTYDNYLLALSIDPSSGLPPHPRKYYKKSLVHINLFNDFSGIYSVAENVQYEVGRTIEGNGEETIHWKELAVDTRNSWVYDENTVFFYAGVTDEDALDRKEYRVYMRFIPSEENDHEGTIEMWSDNDKIEFNFESTECAYVIAEVPDMVKPYLIRRYVSAQVEYTYIDHSLPDYPTLHRYAGMMTMERVLNTLMPEEYQIQWKD